MTVNQMGLLLEVLSKDKGGFVLVASTMTGNVVRLHTFDDFSNQISTNRIVEYSYEIRRVGNGSQRTYNVLTKRPKEVGTLSNMSTPTLLINKLYDWYNKNGLSPLLNQVNQSTDHMVNAANQYLKNPKRYQKYDEKEVWGRGELVADDVETMYDKYSPGRGTEFIPTYNKKYDSQHWDEQISDKNDEIFTETVESVTRNYRNKAQYMTLSGQLTESQLSRLVGRKTGLILTKNEENDPSGLNFYPETGTSTHVDSIFAQVCLKERHIAEFYLYFAISTYMKRARRYPNAKADHILAFLRSFCDKSGIKHGLKAALMRLYQVGMIEIEGNPQKASEIRPEARVSLLKQASYVRKHEKAWNSKNRRGLRPKRIWRENRPKVDYLHPTNRDMAPLEPDAWIDINSVFRPYFDLHFPKTAKQDTGFIHLLNGSAADQRAFMYELVVSSWNYPVSRTRISMNLLITPSTQRQYERKNQAMAKRFSHMEIPKDMLDRMSHSARKQINEAVRTGGKFKQSKSGKIYRQEGNTYISNRVEWKHSKNCSRLRLSPKHIKLWKAGQPVFTKSMTMDGKPACSEAHFMPVNEEVCKGQPLSKTYISKKADIHKGKYFALQKEGVLLVSTDPSNWTWFEPLLEYDNRNGDMLVPLAPSLTLKSQQQWASAPEVFGAREAGTATENYRIIKKLKRTYYAS